MTVKTLPNLYTSSNIYMYNKFLIKDTLIFKVIFLACGINYPGKYYYPFLNLFKIC